MEKQPKKPGRRSATEWKSLLEAWKDSGLSAAEFGDKHGIEGSRLTWWKWHLGRSGAKRHRGSAAKTKRSAGVKLVKVDVVAAGSAPEVASQWEIHTAGGDRLRVTESLTIDELEVILRSFGLAGRAR